jgi:hypothetical protein
MILEYTVQQFTSSAQREYIITKEEANDTMSDSGNPMSSPNIDVDRLKEYMDSMSRSDAPDSADTALDRFYKIIVPPVASAVVPETVISNGVERRRKRKRGRP